MPKLAVIDDRDEREIVVDSIDLVLPDGWRVIGIPPLVQMDYYPGWIIEEEIASLIVDERLDESPINGGQFVSYNGHDLVDFLRKHLPDYPIYIVTSYPDDSDLTERYKDVEQIITRGLFNNEPEKYVPRILRAGKQYLSVFEKELAELAAFATKSATGEPVSNEETQRAKAIQTKLETAFPVDDISSRSEWLSKMDSLLQDLEALRDEIEERVNKS